MNFILFLTVTIYVILSTGCSSDKSTVMQEKDYSEIKFDVVDVRWMTVQQAFNGLVYECKIQGKSIKLILNIKDEYKKHIIMADFFLENDVPFEAAVKGICIASGLNLKYKISGNELVISE